MCCLAAVAMTGCAGVGPSRTEIGQHSAALNSSLANTVAPRGAGDSPWSKMTASVGSGAKKIGAMFSSEPKFVPTRDRVYASQPAPQPGADFFVQAARMQQEMGDSAAAEIQYRKALELEPDNLQALLEYGHLLDRRQTPRDIEQAAVYYERAVKAHPESSSAHNDLALCYARRGMLDRAKQSLAKAIELTPGNPLYRNNMAMVLVVLGDDRQALAHLRAGHPPHVAHYNLGVLLQKQNRLDAARHHFAEALRHRPDMNEARTWLASLSGESNDAAIGADRPPLNTGAVARPTAPPASANPATSNAGSPPARQYDRQATPDVSRHARYEHEANAPDPPGMQTSRQVPVRLPPTGREAAPEGDIAPLPRSY